MATWFREIDDLGEWQPNYFTGFAEEIGLKKDAEFPRRIRTDYGNESDMILQLVELKKNGTYVATYAQSGTDLKLDLHFC